MGYQLVQTMLINAFLPLPFELLPVLMKWYLQRADQSWEKDEKRRLYSTKQTQIYKYLDLYVGYEYIVHFKYASVLNVTFVTMLYGPGLPILFPIATLFLFNARISERISVAYFSKQPPAMGDTLSTAALDLMKYAPIVMMFNGYWMLGNKQIF